MWHDGGLTRGDSMKQVFYASALAFLVAFPVHAEKCELPQVASLDHLIHCLHRQSHLAAVIEAKKLHLDRLTFADDVAPFSTPVPRCERDRPLGRRSSQRRQNPSS